MTPKLISDLEWNQLRRDSRHFQEQRARDLCLKAGVEFRKPCSLEDMAKFQAVLTPKYQLVVMTHNNKKPAFVGPVSEQQIGIFYHGNHYDALLSIKSFLGASYYCEVCIKGFAQPDKHSCLHTCGACYKRPLCKPGEPTVCEDCNRSFVSALC
jgi:hypothetical protein